MYTPYDRLLDKIAYISGVILLFTGITGIYIINRFDMDLNKYIQPCMLNSLTGLYCPGCGGTRSVKYLLGGHILKSLYYNPFVAYVFFPWIWFIFTHSLRLLKIRCGIKNADFPTGRLFHPLTVRPRYIYVGIVILLLQCLIKNIVFLCLSVSLI